MKPSPYILKLLAERQAEGLPVGYCKWSDGDAYLWGLVREFSDDGIEFQDISPLGELEETVYRYWSRFYEFDFGKVYAQRLIALGEFKPTLLSETKWSKSAKERDSIIISGFENNLPVRVEAKDMDRGTIQVHEIEGNVVVYQRLDDLCRPGDFCACKLSMFRRARHPDAMAEADAWLRDRMLQK